MVAIRIFNIWWFLFIFFIKCQRWWKVLCLINCNHQKIFFRFYWWKDFTIPKKYRCRLRFNKYLKDWQISKKWCSEKHCSCDNACQFSALYGTPWWSYLEKSDSWRQIYKQTSLTFYTSNNVCKWCWKKKLLWC